MCMLDKEKEKQYKREWYLRNRHILNTRIKTPEEKAIKAAYDKERRNKHRDKLNAYDKERARRPARKALHSEESRRRKMSIKQASPSWSCEFNEFFIKEIYHLAAIRTKATNVQWQVDHVIPLKGKEVSGLHIWNNLQLLTAFENNKKGNSYVA